MDTITQAVLGASVGEAGWRKELGPRVIPVGIGCGLLPDFDILTVIAGSWNEMIHHRGFTHSIIFPFLFAPLLGWMAWKWSKRGALWSWIHFVFWAIITHPLLDIFTTYGTQFFVPFSFERLSLDGVAVVDPLYTLPLMFALSLGYLYRKRPNIGRRAVQIGLVVSSLYLGFGLVQNRRARTFASHQISQMTFQALDIRAVPTLFNLWVWRILARDKNGEILVGLLSLWNPKPIDFQIVKRPSHPLIGKTLAHRRGELLQWFSSNMFSVRVEEHGKGKTSIFVEDQRFGFMAQPSKAIFGGRADFDAEGKLLRFVRVRPAPGQMDFKKEISTLWSMFWTGRKS